MLYARRTAKRALELAGQQAWTNVKLLMFDGTVRDELFKVIDSLSAEYNALKDKYKAYLEDFANEGEDKKKIQKILEILAEENVTTTEEAVKRWADLYKIKT